MNRSVCLNFLSVSLDFHVLDRYILELVAVMATTRAGLYLNAPYSVFPTTIISSEPLLPEKKKKKRKKKKEKNEKESGRGRETEENEGSLPA